MENAQDPFELFQRWLAEAEKTEVNDANAMSVATVDAEGRPSVRIVLLKKYDAEGFVFFTNFESRKGEELKGNPNAALCFHWKSLRRQVRIDGTARPVSDAEADAYFASRPRDSRIGAWASIQSRPLDKRETFEERIREFDARYPGENVPRPPHWSGFRIVPRRIEFWQDQAFRLHERVVFNAEKGIGVETVWSREWLYP